MIQGKSKQAVERPPMRDYLGMFDLTKGFFIIMIIVGHSITTHFNYWIFDIENSPALGIIVRIAIFLFQTTMAPFFMIGGYSFRKRSMKTCVKTQAHYFLKPYICVAAAVALLTVIKKIMISGNILEGLEYQVLPFLFGLCPGKKHFLGIYMADIGPIWFLLVFVLATILLNAIMHESQMWVQVLWIASLSFVGIFLKDVSLPFCIQQTLICCGYFYVGMLMKKYKFFQRKIPVSFVVLAVIICCVSTLFGEIAVAGNRWKLNMFDLFASYFAGILYMIIFQKLNTYGGKLFEFIRWMGRHVLWFCCVHTVFYLVLPWDDFSRLFINRKMLGIIIEIILQGIIAVVGCKVIDQLMKKHKSRKLISHK